MSRLSPDYTFLCYREVTADFLRAQGISYLLLDIDNTLAPYEQPDPDAHIRAWLEALREAGIKVAFVSNNHGDRVERFNATLGLPLQCDAKKPLARRAKRLLASLGGTRENSALMGDQIFTDVLCAHNCGIRAILVPPIKDRTDRLTRFKRYFERGVLRRYYKKHQSASDIRKGSPLAAEHNKEKV